ncbi:hypothetical protein CN918_27460 [Priestia megaterium]|nr:hypothetical protein CN918_27460 [Priestia megaterium]
MYHMTSTSKTTTANGYNEAYKLKRVNSLRLNRFTYSGGFDEINATSEDRLFIVEKGTGFVTTLGKTHELHKGSVLEVPKSQSVSLSSAQIIFYVVSAPTGQITLSSFTYSGGFQPIETSNQDRLLIVESGTGFVQIGSKTLEIKENSVLEIPSGETISLSSANITFHVATSTL